MHFAGHKARLPQSHNVSSLYLLIVDVFQHSSQFAASLAHVHRQVPFDSLLYRF